MTLLIPLYRMNRSVPNLEEDYPIPTSSEKSAMNEDDITELVLENDQVVWQSESQRSPNESALPKYHAALVNHHHQQQQIQQNLFMQGDEMASWLHYPLLDPNFGNDFCADVLYPPSSAVCLISATICAPVAAVASTSTDTKMTTCEMTVTSSSGGASAYDRKRKGKDKEPERHTTEAELESAEAKKPARGSTSTKRSRVAEVHNQSERRRRDRINQKMRALQELIPCCNKSDKASMLEDAIEYLKSLQMQIQMMSMGCNMVPVMFPGVQRYMPPMGMGMDRPTGASFPTPQTVVAAEAHLGPRFPMLPYQMPPVTSSPPDTSTTPSSCVSKC